MNLRDIKICREFKQINNLIRRQNESLSVNKMTLSCGWIIGYLYENRDRVVLQKEFEKEFGIRRSTITSILQTMEKNELLQRVPLPDDARQRQLILTKKAEELHLSFVDKMQVLDHKMIDGISDEDLEVFYRVLFKMKRNLEE